VRGLQEVVHLAIQVQQSPSGSLGQHHVWQVRQNFGRQGCAQETHGQTRGQHSLRKMQQDVFNAIRSQQAQAEHEMRVSLAQCKLCAAAEEQFFPILAANNF
jgi:hypothetical protein